MKKTPDRYAVCVNNEGHNVSLERRKLYRVLPPESLDPVSLIRVVDESGERYLFPESWFAAVSLPMKVRKAICDKGELKRRRIHDYDGNVRDEVKPESTIASTSDSTPPGPRTRRRTTAS